MRVAAGIFASRVAPRLLTACCFLTAALTSAVAQTGGSSFMLPFGGISDALGDGFADYAASAPPAAKDTREMVFEEEHADAAYYAVTGTSASQAAAAPGADQEAQRAAKEDPDAGKTGGINFILPFGGISDALGDGFADFAASAPPSAVMATGASQASPAARTNQEAQKAADKDPEAGPSNPGSPETEPKSGIKHFLLPLGGISDALGDGFADYVASAPAQGLAAGSVRDQAVDPQEVSTVTGTTKLQALPLPPGQEVWRRAGNGDSVSADSPSSIAVAPQAWQGQRVAEAQKGESAHPEDQKPASHSIPPTGPIREPSRPATPQAWRGQVGGAPSRRQFEFSEELVAKCKDASQPFPVNDYPLSMSAELYCRILLSKETWAGLKFGAWMDPQYENAWRVVKAALPRMMMDVMPAEARHKTCAVVGSSGNMVYSKFGPQIDAHEAVFRVNKAPREGYHEEVGSKFTYRFLNKREFGVYANGGRTETKVEMVPDDDNGIVIVSRSPPDRMAEDIPRAIEWAKSKGKNLTFTSMSMQVFHHANQLLSVHNKCMEMRGGSAGGADFKSATSGFMTAFLAMHFCDHVTVYGLGESLIYEDTPYQYFALRFPGSSVSNIHPNHSLELEGKLLEALACGGVIRRCSVRRGCYGAELPVASQRPAGE
mmetsp:Transcript_12343/g.34651  ORF Transcript_12343/g.34651 Transcript_12343/m.34651 type:complete len:660 (+) Transcript_12343:103-2082(+)